MNKSSVILAWPLLVPMGSLCAFAAVRSLWRGQILTAVVAVGGCAFLFGMLIPAAKALRGRVTPLVEFDDEGSTFRPDREMDIPVQVSMLGGVHFYWERAEFRDELTVGRAIERLAELGAKS